MTSISATSNNNYLSPLQLLQNELQSEVSSGTISSSDQSALSSALTDINSALQSGSSSASSSSASSSTNSSPGDLQSKINTLIAGEVSSGKLTSAQATELQGVFTAAFANGPGAGAPPATGPATGAAAAIGTALRRRSGGPGGAGSRTSRPSPWRPWRDHVDGQFVIDQQHQQFVKHQFRRQCSAAVSAIAAGFAVVLVVLSLWRDRNHRHQQQQQCLGLTSDQLQDLIPANTHTDATKPRNACSISSFFLRERLSGRCCGLCCLNIIRF